MAYAVIFVSKMKEAAGAGYDAMARKMDKSECAPAVMVVANSSLTSADDDKARSFCLLIEILAPICGAA